MNKGRCFHTLISSTVVSLSTVTLCTSIVASARTESSNGMIAVALEIRKDGDLMYCMYKSTESFKPFQLFSCVSEQIMLWRSHCAHSGHESSLWRRHLGCVCALRRAEGQKALTERGWSMMSESPCPVTTCHNL